MRTHREPPYRRYSPSPRLAGLLLLLLGAVQLLSPLHSWLESSAERVHHDGFVWYATAPTQDDCHDATGAARDCHESDCATGDRHGMDCAKGEGHERDCKDGHCHDNNCQTGCTHISIQFVLHAAPFDTDVPLTSAIPSISTTILPGIHPETFLPPRS